MPVEGVDYAWARPNPKGLRAAGKVFAGRYVGVGSEGKRLTRVEAEQLSAVGVSVVALCEQGARTALMGRAMGRQHAAAALKEAVVCGMPSGRPIYFAVDFDASAAELSTVGSYFEGVAEVLPSRQIGAYGGIRTIDWLFDRGLIRWGFQTYAWSGGRWDNRAQMQQYRNGVTVAGATVDLCRGMTVDYGQWRPGQSGAPGEDGEMPTVEEVWSADEIPVGGDPSNPTWQAKNAIGYTLDLVKAIKVDLDAVAAKVDALEDRPTGLSTEDREAIVTDVVARIQEGAGLFPTAGEIRRAVGIEIAERMAQ